MGEVVIPTRCPHLPPPTPRRNPLEWIHFDMSSTFSPRLALGTCNGFVFSCSRCSLCCLRFLQLAIVISLFRSDNHLKNGLVANYNKHSLVLQGLISELVTNCDGSLKTEVTNMAAHYEHRIHQGNKAIYHLEAFVAKFMSIYKRFLEEGMADFF